MSTNIFNKIQVQVPNRNAFDLTHDVKMSMKFDYLYPCLALEVLPGDKFNIGCDSLLRFAPLVSPVMHRLDMTVHYWFVPNRILWPSTGGETAGNITGWEGYVSGQNWQGNQPEEHPYIQISNATDPDHLKFLDYLGVAPPETGVGTSINAFPMAAYQRIYEEFYRDQNMMPINQLTTLSAGSNSLADLCTLQKRAWQHDYFTSALPQAQKGLSVDLPVGVVQLVDPAGSPQANAGKIIEQSTGANISGPLDSTTGTLTTNTGTNDPSVYDPNGTLQTEPVSIATFRRALKIQEWMELAARVGGRYAELLKGFFNIRPQDARLNRPEYISGVKTPVVISEVLNTSGQETLDPDEPGLPQGNMAGHGIAVSQGKSGEYFSHEHGWIIGIVNVAPKTAYQQGVHRSFLKVNNKYEYFWKQFEHIGEQAITLNELYLSEANDDETVFGYIPRYAEYKYLNNRVAGDFRTSLTFWHLGRIFATPPALNSVFIEQDARTNIFAVVDGTDYLYLHMLHKIYAVRPLAKYGNPGI